MVRNYSLCLFITLSLAPSSTPNSLFWDNRVNLLPLEIKDPGIQFMTGLKWFRIIVIQGCRIRSNEAKDQILSSLGVTSYHLFHSPPSFFLSILVICFIIYITYSLSLSHLERFLIWNISFDSPSARFYCASWWMLFFIVHCVVYWTNDPGEVWYS